MSRALDKDVIAFLQHGDPRKVYEEIASLWTIPSPSDGPLLEIEFLGRSQPLQPGESFLREANAVAIPKLRLVQAFMIARQILSQHLEDEKQAGEDLLAATSVLLLMDPEHLTAANTRKRVLLRITSGQDVEAARSTLVREKYFLDSLLTSRLHRHTKSPTLWSHRRWLLHTMIEAGVGVSVLDELKAVIMVAGERHPRNYYAWSHARLLLEMMNSRPSDESIRDGILVAVGDWCLAHHADISGWSFLLDLLVDSGWYGPNEWSQQLHATLGLVASFHWRNESVWWFLQMLATRTHMGEDDMARFHRVREELLDGVAENSLEGNILRRAGDSCESRSQAVAVPSTR